MLTTSFPAGGYRYIPGVFQYSGGVAAEPGFEIVRVRFHRWMPLAAGFEAVRVHLERLGRSPTALCACELRSPAPFTDDGFTAFNREYIKPLEQWGLYRDGANPVARSNVCPEFQPPAEPCFYAFSFTMPAQGRNPAGFVIAGSGEAREGAGRYADRMVRPGDHSPDALREKAQFVLSAMESRMAALGVGWPDVTGAHVYSVFDIHPLLRDKFLGPNAMRFGLNWHFARPPVVGLDYEMDVRGISQESVLYLWVCSPA
jgi:hypothetical protein